MPGKCDSPNTLHIELVDSGMKITAVSGRRHLLTNKALLLETTKEILQKHPPTDVRPLDVTISALHYAGAPIRKHFHLFLELLEIVVALKPNSLRINTSSALVLFAAPVLKGLGNKLSICMLIEPMHGMTSRSREQQAAIASLKNIGINVSTQ